MIQCPELKVYAVQSKPELFLCWMNLHFYHFFLSIFFFFPFVSKQLVFDAFDNGSASAGQPEIVLPNGRI